LANGAFSAVIRKPYEFEEIRKMISVVISKIAAPVACKNGIRDHGDDSSIGTDGARKRTAD